MNDNNLVQSVDRALSITEFLAECPNGAGITDISKALGLSKATVHRLISTLKSRDFVTQSKNTEQYYLGYRLLYLSSCVSKNTDIFKVSRPIISSFADKVDATVHLSVLDDTRTNIIYVDKIEPTNSNKTFVMSSKVGKKAPCYCTAAGKLLLSNYSDEEIREIMKDVNFEIYTQKTIKNIDEFIEEIHEVREKGYALDKHEYDSGIICISMPIYGSGGKMELAMSVTGLIIYSTVEDLIDLKEPLGKVSTEISNTIKYL
ncbi:IclR family transcriptional regulator [Clostridium sp. CCUG 7971]|uniref:IclR family transcriptional regulator n=1 Tax=Clostridium sp. CCUG 7971 TaxID=2811414 RepID=UPI001ABA41F1|nr:IclR family transcriptional regulator [Clostridium sp. CCUG 7971]MBO3444774.1 IclR family transcriptional regulator [Clostridium sp. CCUG 7971]